MILNQEFESHFQNEYGLRWADLLTSLKQPPLQVLRRNTFFKNAGVFQAPGQSLEGLAHCFLPGKDKSIDLDIKSDVFQFYLMDPASVIVAGSLPIQPGDRVLDMCAAPGGKSLILAEKLFSTDQENQSELVCNELSNSRRERLKYILQNYIPREKRQSIFIKGIDGQLFAKREPENYDAILLDAPCTGERHLIEDASEFRKWTLKRSKSNAVRQFSLLSSAWHALKPGGIIMYSTCSISEIENDLVVEKLVDRRSVEVLPVPHIENLKFIEKTKFGYAILPDSKMKIDEKSVGGAGPMFFSLIHKTK